MGATGAMGAMGATGATGATGAMGATGATGAGLDLETAMDQDPNAGEGAREARSTRSVTRRGRTVMG